MRRPYFILVGGPNGAGKTTLGQTVVRECFGIGEYLNADVIARGLVGLPQRGKDIAAGKLLITILRENFARGSSFAVESTLSSHAARRWATKARQLGYKVALVYFYLNSSTLASRRVKIRVGRGGHNITPPVVRRRYKESIKQLKYFYLPNMEEFIVINNTRKPSLIAFKSDAIMEIKNEKLWKQISQTGSRVGQ